MYCYSCGNLRNDIGYFCQHCGASIEQKEIAQPCTQTQMLEPPAKQLNPMKQVMPQMPEPPAKQQSPMEQVMPQLQQTSQIDAYSANTGSHFMKNVLLILAVMFIAMAAVAMTVIIFFRVTEQTPQSMPLTVAQMLDLGETYLLELNYEQALVQFLGVIEVEPRNPRGYTGAAEAYVGLGDTDNAVSILEQGQVAIGGDASIQQMLDEINDAQEARRQEERETEEARRQAEREAEETRRQAEIVSEIERELNKLLEIYETDNADNIFEVIGSDVFNEMLSKIIDFPFILLNETGSFGIGVYEGDYIYIGGYADRQRSGHGIWVRSGNKFDGELENINFKFNGEWENDLPNGSGVVILGSGGALTSGVLVNGFWNGSVTRTNDLVNYSLEFEDGRIVSIGEPEYFDLDFDGVFYTWVPVSYIDSDTDIFCFPESYNELYGILPFTEFFMPRLLYRTANPMR